MTKIVANSKCLKVNTLVGVKFAIEKINIEIGRLSLRYRCFLIQQKVYR